MFSGLVVAGVEEGQSQGVFTGLVVGRVEEGLELWYVY